MTLASPDVLCLMLPLRKGLDMLWGQQANVYSNCPPEAVGLALIPENLHEFKTAA